MGSDYSFIYLFRFPKTLVKNNFVEKINITSCAQGQQISLGTQNEPKNSKGLWSFPNVLFNQSYSTIHRNMRYQHSRYNKKARSKVNNEVVYLPQTRIKHWQSYKHFKRNHKIKQNHLPHNFKKAHRRITERKMKPSISFEPFYHDELPRDADRAVVDSREQYESGNPNPLWDRFISFPNKAKYKSKIKPRNVSDEYDEYMFEDYEDITPLSASTPTETIVKGSEQNDFKSQGMKVQESLQHQQNLTKTIPLQYSKGIVQSNPLLSSNLNQQFQQADSRQNVGNIVSNAPTFGRMGSIAPSFQASADGNAYQPQQDIPNFRNGAVFQQQQLAQFETKYAGSPSMNIFSGIKVLNSSYNVNKIRNDTSIVQYLQDKIYEIASIHNRFGREKTMFVMSAIVLLLLLVAILVAITCYKRYKDRAKKTYPFKKKNKYSFLRTSRQQKKDLLKQFGRIKFDNITQHFQLSMETSRWFTYD